MLSGSPVQKKKMECFFFLIQIIHQPSSSESFARQRKRELAWQREKEGGKRELGKERDVKGPSSSSTAGAMSRLLHPLAVECRPRADLRRQAREQAVLQQNHNEDGAS